MNTFSIQVQMTCGQRSETDGESHPRCSGRGQAWRIEMGGWFSWQAADQLRRATAEE